jgi:hypothetical protein
VITCLPPSQSAQLQPPTASVAPCGRPPCLEPLSMLGSAGGAVSLEAAPDQQVLEGSAAQTPVWVFGELCCTTGWADPCCAVLCCAVLCCAVLCCAVLCCAVLCCVPC